MPEIFENFVPDEMQIVIPKLTEVGRYYHDIRHISRMLATHELWKHHTSIIWTPENEIVIYLAILYHDVVYDIKKGEMSSEKKSSDFFRLNQRTLKSPDLIDKVAKAIEATEFHFDEKFEPASELIKYFMDLDLMQLCTSDVDILIQDNADIDAEFLTAYNPGYVRKSRYNFIAGPMKNAKLRHLTNPVLAENMRSNINFLEGYYE